MNDNGNTSAMSRRTFLAGSGAAGVAVAWGFPEVVGAAGMDGPAAGCGLEDLEVFADGYPRAVFFRKAPGVGRADEFDEEAFGEWMARWRGLDGLVGKVLGEELTGARGLALEYYREFKLRNRSKLVLLHFNGKGRRPAFRRERFSARHWLYLAGSTVTEPGEGTRVWVGVEDATRFKCRRPKGRGNYDEYPDDLVIVPPDGAGGRDWSAAEQARLAVEGVDEPANRIEIERGVWDPVGPRIEPGTYIAPHARIRPEAVADRGETLWLYNFNPRAVGEDEPTCADVLVDELREEFSDDRRLGLFDGVQFDVMFFVPNGDAAHPPVLFCYDEAQVDVDNDGQPDGGLDRDTNGYGLGVSELGRKLREALPGKLLLADGMLPEVHQRNFGSFDGIESEGFPVLRDPDFAEWSPGLNRHAFWQSRGGACAFNYVLFKYVGDQNQVGGGRGPDDDPDEDQNPGPAPDPVAYARLRLAAAAAVFTDAAFAIGSNLARDPDGEPQVFDELWNGTSETPNWLGEPDGPAVHLATRTRDLCDRAGVEWPVGFVDQIAGPGATVTRETDPRPHVRVSWSPDAADEGTAEDTGVPLRKVTVPVPTPFPETAPPREVDLVVELTLSADGVAGYPRDIARRIRVQAFIGEHAVPTAPNWPDDGQPARFYHTWADEQQFTSTFLFRNAPAGQATIDIVAEGGAELRLHRLTVHVGDDGTTTPTAHGVMREFTHGAVIANPSHHPVTFDLAHLFDGQAFRHIQGHDIQDLETNDGQAVTAPERIDPLDALFLVNEPGS